MNNKLFLTHRDVVIYFNLMKLETDYIFILKIPDSITFIFQYNKDDKKY